MPRKQNRNAQGGGNICQRFDGRWEGRYASGRDPETDRQVQRLYKELRKRKNEKVQQLKEIRYDYQHIYILAERIECELVAKMTL